MNEHTADTPPESDGTQARPAAVEGPGTIIARIQTAGDVVPATLRDAVYGVDKRDPPSLVIESAEGITTFAGFNGNPGTPRAAAWLEDRLKEIAQRYRSTAEATPEAPTGPSAEPAAPSSDP
jgi:hypothetical protein